MLEVYEKSVTELRNEMIELGIKVEQAVDNAWKALEQKDIELANRIYNGDDEIDTMVRDCMKKDLTISMMQGPVAADYRALMATLKILSDLERIADHCADISHYVIHLEKTHHNRPLPAGLREMYGVMSSMVSDVIDFYKEKGSAGRAGMMRDKDDIVDMAFNSIMAEISKEITAHPENSRDYIAIVLVVKYIERMADHANNIAEWLIYRDTNELRI
ncbi:phosphate signaling complex protein PhoU [Megasphaera sp. DJF_B143]|uniref:phosphate signaling complex protein PhoU n=1 Tax=Megasphaera sp. DJF_B143 TaxID=537288 RepID=UPI00124328F1|nr:phosphate signaling complex protein PhoU [Megasphaera sp. DJF_B143]